MSTKIRNKLPCYCKTCNGKIVDERTKKSHEELETQLAFNVSGFVLSANMNMLLSNPEPNMTPSQQLIAMEIDKPIIEGSSRKEIGSEQESSGDDNYEADFEHYARQRQDRFQELDANQCDENSNDDESTKSI
ncbi:7265_t:CDS:1, partial [Rhizophagus irregularis]